MWCRNFIVFVIFAVVDETISGKVVTTLVKRKRGMAAVVMTSNIY